MRTVSQALTRLTLATLLLVGAQDQSQAADAPKVVASIGPVGSLAAAVMQGMGTPVVLLPGGASPHSYALRPSDARALASADLVLWVGEALETFLEEPLETLAQPSATVELMELDGLTLLPNRSGGIWEADHDHEHADNHGHGKTDKHEHGHEHEHGAVDPHIWLDPGNAAVIVDGIAAALAQRDPARAEAYRLNAAAAKQRIAALDAELAEILRPLADRPYVVFHDGYQYLERHYALTPLGAVTLGPERAPGAKRLASLRAEIQERGASCVFREPQFEPKILASLDAGAGIRVGVLDPLGTEIAPGPDGYGELMRNLAAALRDCLTPAG